MVLGELTVPGRPTSLSYSGERVYCLQELRVGVVWTFLARLSFLFSFPLSWRWSDKTEILSQSAVKVVIITNLGQRQKSA